MVMRNENKVSKNVIVRNEDELYGFVADMNMWHRDFVLLFFT